MKPTDLSGAVKIVRWSVIGGLLMTLLVLWAFREREHPAIQIIRERREQAKRDAEQQKYQAERDLICQQDFTLARSMKDSVRVFVGRGPLNEKRSNGFQGGQCLIENGKVRWVR
jgi:hypothetical protein